MPLTWTLIVCASLPFGIWTQSEGASRADSSRSGNTVDNQATTASLHQQAFHTPHRSSDAIPSQSLPTAPNGSTASVPSDQTEIESPATAPATPGLWQSAREGFLKFNPLAQLPAVAQNTYSVRAVVAGRARTARVEVPVRGASVGDVLLKMGIELGPLDRVSPLAAVNAYNGMTVRVTRVASPLKTRRETVPFETRYQPTTEIGKGETKVIQAGRSGAIEITERVWMVDGKVTKREVVSRRVARSAQPCIVGLGTHAAYLPGRIPYHNRYARSFSLSARAGSPRDRFGASSNESFRALRSITLVATGYSPDPSENGGYTTTCTGLPIGYGAAAVDPRVIPLGTKLYVEGYGYAFACDTGGAIKGRRIDLAFDSYGVANSKGHRKMRVWILGK